MVITDRPGVQFPPRLMATGVDVESHESWDLCPGASTPISDPNAHRIELHHGPLV